MKLSTAIFNVIITATVLSAPIAKEETESHLSRRQGGGLALAQGIVGIVAAAKAKKAAAADAAAADAAAADAGAADADAAVAAAAAAADVAAAGAADAGAVDVAAAGAADAGAVDVAAAGAVDAGAAGAVDAGAAGAADGAAAAAKGKKDPNKLLPNTYAKERHKCSIVRNTFSNRIFCDDPINKLDSLT
ncbi:hypothetical protein BC833DRAFT_563890 [Globomyces pollinis-pini]|nr:hypothetical protein BC833DRAFT_563890 [Globomyces pollinis-pini]